MFMKTYHMMFYFSLISGSMISISSNNWFTAWLGLEINLMSMIPLILFKMSSKLSEASIKYFLSQAIASLIMIISIFVLFNFMENNIMNLNNNMMLLAMLMKTGIPPFHFWFPQIINLMSWIQCFIILTWQKLAPLMLLFLLSNKAVMISIILAAGIGALGGLNQNNVKIIMAYSSISHSAWMLLAMMESISFLLFYYISYILISTSLILILKKMNINKINETNMKNISLFDKLTFILNILSLGGMPPLLGFSAKLFIFYSAINSNSYFMFIFLITSTLISLFFYLRMIYFFMTFKYNIMFININKKMNKKYSLIFISSFTNIFIPLFLIIL
uniref:NADH-ubiquinone oxidoreductase chain 2 n=1 Tax=Seira pallidipes TaxID=3053390 RepID=A0AAU6QCK3_9HEXA